MKFLDQAKIYARSGHGGPGAVSFRREAHVPFGGPDGGNGGSGGNIVALAVNGLNTLIDYRYQQHFKAESGRPGAGRDRSGASGKDVIIRLPLGTQILSDDQKRQTYDNFGHEGVNSSFSSSQGAADAFSDIFGDIFSDIFGGSSGGRTSSRGADLSYNLEVTLEEAVFGKSLNIEIPSKERCGGLWNRCSYCGGAGVIRQQQGFFSMQQTCPHCRGEGEIHDKNCSKCNGSGFTSNNKKLSVKIPAGVDDGDRIRLSGEGELGRGGNRGDLYISINVKEHSIFERDGRHLYCEVPLDFVDAALGGSIEVPTLVGKAKIKIPSGTQSHKIFRLNGKGIKPLRGGSVGDILVRVIVEVPVNLNAEQKNLLNKFKENMSHENNSPLMSSWLNSAKAFFKNL